MAVVLRVQIISYTGFWDVREQLIRLEYSLSAWVRYVCVRAWTGERERKWACACSREVAEVESGVNQFSHLSVVWFLSVTSHHACLLIKMSDIDVFIIRLQTLMC